MIVSTFITTCIKNIVTKCCFSYVLLRPPQEFTHITLFIMNGIKNIEDKSKSGMILRFGEMQIPLSDIRV